MGEPRTALVVGGGIIGVSSAYALGRDGWNVHLIDRLPDVGLGTSFGNGRQLSYSHTNALASPKLLPQIPQLLMGCNDAFRLSLRADPGFLMWMLRFLRNCTSAAYRENTLSTLNLADRSRKAMDRLLDRHPIAFDRQKVGKIVLLRDQMEVEAARDTMELKRSHGLRQSLLCAEQAVEIEPALEQAPGTLAGALYSPDDETGDCHKFASELLALASREYGVTFSGDCEVQSLEQGRDGAIATLADGRRLAADLAVVANGHHANRLIAPIRRRLPIEPMKGYSFTAPLGNSAPRASITDNRRRIVFTNLGDRMLVAGIAEMGRVDCEIDPQRLEAMVEAARCSLPEAAVYSEADNGWVGHRPMTPNSQPITRKLSRSIAVNAGHGMLGWTLAMGSAERLSEIVNEAD